MANALRQEDVSNSVDIDTYFFKPGGGLAMKSERGGVHTPPQIINQDDFWDQLYERMENGSFSSMRAEANHKSLVQLIEPSDYGNPFVKLVYLPTDLETTEKIINFQDRLNERIKESNSAVEYFTPRVIGQSPDDQSTTRRMATIRSGGSSEESNSSKENDKDTDKKNKGNAKKGRIRNLKIALACVLVALTIGAGVRSHVKKTEDVGLDPTKSISEQLSEADYNELQGIMSSGLTQYEAMEVLNDRKDKREIASEKRRDTIQLFEDVRSNAERFGNFLKRENAKNAGTTPAQQVGDQLTSGNSGRPLH